MKNRTNYVYLFTSPSGKNYVGITVEPDVRHNKHRSDAYNPKVREYTYALSRAIRKYGIENFEYSIIFIFTNLLSRDAAERYFIAEYNGYTKGYNLTKGGEGGVGRILSKEGHKNASWGQMGNKNKLGHKATQETKDKMSKVMQGHKRCVGRKYNKETIRKMQISQGRSVKAFDKDGNFVAWYINIKEAARDMKVAGAAIGQAIKKGWKCKGLKWEYATSK